MPLGKAMPVPLVEGTALCRGSYTVKRGETMSEKSASALQGDELHRQFTKLEGWILAEDRHLEKEYRFPDFREALAYVNRLGEVAEREGHHPDIFLTWGRVKVTLW